MASRNATLLRLYGITEEQYDAILSHQGGICAICRRPPKTKRLAVDHDHRTGEVRGLLCSTGHRGGCNWSLIGRRDKDPELFLRAYEYLTDPPARKVLTEPDDESSLSIHEEGGTE